jgi:hypothetical protein
MAQLGVVSCSADASVSSVAPHGGSPLAFLSIEGNLSIKDGSSILTETLVGLSKPKKKRRDPRNNNYLWLLRAPNWMTSRVLEISGMKTPGGWDWRLLTYIEFPWSGEIDYYLKEGKIQNLQNLFASGHLSPLVRMQGSGRTLLHVSSILTPLDFFSVFEC